MMMARPTAVCRKMSPKPLLNPHDIHQIVVFGLIQRTHIFCAAFLNHTFGYVGIFSGCPFHTMPARQLFSELIELIDGCTNGELNGQMDDGRTE